MYIFIVNESFVKTDEIEYNRHGDPLWTDHIPFWSPNLQSLKKAIREKYSEEFGTLDFDDPEFHSVRPKNTGDEYFDPIGWIRKLKKEV